MRTLRTVIAALFCIFLMQSADAQLEFSLNPADETGMPGTTVTFNGTLTNVGADIVYLNGDSFSGLGPGFTLDDSDFNNNFPFFLIGGDSATADIFTVTLDDTVLPGDYTGEFSILGGTDPNAEDVLATQNFQIQVPGVPEPGSIALLVGVSIAASGVLVRRRRK
jgi:hypothetical protein